ncbi:hypothetical protein [Candidatus Methylobacter oryzae]|uniref:DUF1461 domain-containing protein n=1 Tax=Candidatus Methylobacter oryzae TaxID=2497749 RepID=A0ABY3CC16_9GAMM|nr:hypothetical protein [Candidatus Methylobacter oryzae]TRW97199.1 hypothetical protein EKO24_007675 [Candidatus Methylobacter oryzae]
MFNSTTLEVAIGLAFCYASVALIVSSINEGLASLLKLRSNLLLEGVKSLLNDPNFEGLALKLYNHGLVGHSDQGNAKTEQDLKNKPSYIDPTHFAVALIDNIQTIPGDFVQLGQDIDAMQDPQLKKLLQGIYGRASGSLDNVHVELAAWFNASMDRLSGKYKRRSQLYCFIIALVIAALFNVDSFYLFKTLWQHPAIAAGIGVADHPTEISWQEFMSLPVGWPSGTFSIISGIQILGWLVTASATLFGAPFWFDFLQKFVSLRGAGNKPGA